MALRFVLSQPALAPLLFAVGLGVVGSGGFAYHYLANSPDVVIRKKSNRDPWNSVSQATNTKLFSYNPDFWASRIDIPDPRAAFKEDSANANGEHLKKAKAAKAKLSKEDVVAH